MSIPLNRIQFPKEQPRRRNDQLLRFILNTYDQFSNIPDACLKEETFLQLTPYVMQDGRRFMLTTKINNLGYLITQISPVTGSKNPLQEMVVKASPEFQRRNADLKLQKRIIQTIYDSIRDVIDGISPAYEVIRRELSLRISDDSDDNVTLVRNINDETLMGTKLTDMLDLDEVYECVLNTDMSISNLIDHDLEKPLYITLGATRLFAFQNAA